MNTTPLPGLPKLICKPIDQQSDLYSTLIPPGNLIFRSFCIENHLDTIFEWTRQVYTKRFWQMDKCTKEELKEIYLCMLQNPHAHSFVAFLDDLLIGQIDLYQVLSDELSVHVQATQHDCGIHLLMLPPEHSRKNLSFYP
jgi:acetyl CoA:N6-hydroxylysine acetyl transferase